MSSHVENSGAEGASGDAPQITNDEQTPDISLGEATWVWARIGLMSFGGPAGQIALMHRILVEEKRWVDETRFLHALNFCMLLPGPEAQQLATYVGWLLHRIRGGLIAGSLFILPGFAVIMGLSYVYVSAGTVPIIQGLFVGLKAAVVVVVLEAVIRIGRRSLRSVAPAALAVLAFLAMFVWSVPFPLVILLAAAAGALIYRISTHGDTGNHEPPDNEIAETDSPVAGTGYIVRCAAVFGILWLAPTAVLLAALGPDNVFSNIAMFFSKMAVVTFGGAYAVLAYVSQEAVATYHWLAPGEMIDGLALAETTPGPLIMVTQFVGFIAAYRDPGTLSPALAALLGGALTTWVTFVPCFLWIFVGAPYIERLRRNRMLSAALSGVTAAVVGVIVNLALWFSIHTLFEAHSLRRFAGAAVELPELASLQIPSLLLTLVAAVLIFRLHISLLSTLAVTGSLGMLSLLL
ncbi:MAG TPA: chromate efflux transporter [Woeseiaceae bacterium]|nr:chromate efflux transporter [Woeseiaceae bacterium]